MILHSVVSSGVENMRSFINSDTFDRDASLLVGSLLDIGQKMATRFPKLTENPLFAHFVQLNGNIDPRNQSLNQLLTQMAIQQLKAVINSDTFPENAAFFVQCVVDAGTKIAAENPQIPYGSDSFFPLPMGDRADNIPGITSLFSFLCFTRCCLDDFAERENSSPLQRNASNSRMLNQSRNNMNNPNAALYYSNPPLPYYSNQQPQQQPPSFDPSYELLQSSSFPGNNTAVVRILRELHDQRQLLQNSLVSLVKYGLLTIVFMIFYFPFPRASDKGFKHLSGRIGLLENKFNNLDQSLKVNQPLVLPDIGDQQLPDDDLESLTDEDEDRRSKSLRQKSGKSNQKKKSKLNATAPANVKSSRDKSGGFRDFRKNARKKRDPEQQEDRDYDRNYQKSRQPDIELVYKNEKGNISTAKVLDSAVEFSRQDNQEDNIGQLPLQVLFSVFS
jgi:hypothetical protein